MSLILDGTTGVPVTTVTGTLPVANGGTGGTTQATAITALGISGAIQSQTYTAFTTGGTSTAYTLTPSPAITVYATGQCFNVTINAVPGLNPTLNISAVGAKNFKYYNAQGSKIFVDASSVIANWVSDVIYDGTDLVLMSPLNRALPSGTQKAIFGYGYTSINVSMTNLVSNTGVVGSDVTGVGTARYSSAAAGFSLT